MQKYSSLDTTPGLERRTYQVTVEDASLSSVSWSHTLNKQGTAISAGRKIKVAHVVRLSLTLRESSSICTLPIRFNRLQQ